MNLKNLFYLNRSDRSVLLLFLALALAALVVIVLSDDDETARSFVDTASSDTGRMPRGIKPLIPIIVPKLPRLNYLTSTPIRPTLQHCFVWGFSPGRSGISINIVPLEGCIAVLLTLHAFTD